MGRVVEIKHRVSQVYTEEYLVAETTFQVFAYSGLQNLLFPRTPFLSGSGACCMNCHTCVNLGELNSSSLIQKLEVIGLKMNNPLVGRPRFEFTPLQDAIDGRTVSGPEVQL